MITPAYAQAQGAGGGDVFVSLLPLILIFIVFYFLLIRPQQQKMKQHRAMLEALKKGDQVLTGGGIFGKVTRIDPDGTVMVEIAQGVVVKVAKATISDVLTKPTPTPAENNPANNPQPNEGGFLSRLFKR